VNTCYSACLTHDPPMRAHLTEGLRTLARSRDPAVAGPTETLVPGDCAGDGSDNCDRKKPAKEVQQGGEEERRAVRVPVTGVSDVRDGQQYFERVQRRVECRVPDWSTGAG
jgi:hypothetical protein